VLYGQEARRAKEEDRDFALSFTQVRNMISKQSMMGEIIKKRQQEKKKRQDKVLEVKSKSSRRGMSSCQLLESRVFSTDKLGEASSSMQRPVMEMRYGGANYS